MERDSLCIENRKKKDSQSLSTVKNNFSLQSVYCVSIKLLTTMLQETDRQNYKRGDCF